MRITTTDVQDLANLVKLEYLPKLKEAIDSNQGGPENSVLGLLQQRYDALEKKITYILEDEDFYIE